jgi:diguanylate cyclase (GGDEF)-like protein
MDSTFIKDARSRTHGPKRLLGAAGFLARGSGEFMQSRTRVYSLPHWRLTRWLADCGPGVPDDIRVELIGNLFGHLPVFASGVISTVAVALVIAARKPTAPFIAWVVFETAVCVVRLVVLLIARRAALKRAETRTDIYLLLAIAWSASVGYGVIVSMASRDWVAATLACVSASAMVGGICFRNFSAPRLAAVMIVTSLGPTIPGALLGGERLLYLVLLQAPLYLGAMTAAAFALNRMLVATMRAERENSRRAKHDALTGLLNREGLIEAIDAGLVAATADGNPRALLFLDLDNFKTANDTFGHAVGDRLLKTVADRVKGELATGDAAARIGGDEFVVLAVAATQELAIERGERLISAIASTYLLGEGISAAVGASIGIAMTPEHGSNAECLLAAADAALYEAKSGGRSRCCVASAASSLAALRRLQVGIGACAAGSIAA